VKCVVKTIIKSGSCDLVKLQGGLIITPWHPVRINGKWRFPSELAATEKINCDSVYNIVLDSVHTMMINGIEVVTLAHGFKEEVVVHEYFGTNKVIEDLKRLGGFEEGLVMLSESAFVRDSKSNLIVGLKGKNEIKNQTNIINNNNNLLIV